jgi:hypothetical protein
VFLVIFFPFPINNISITILGKRYDCACLSLCYFFVLDARLLERKSNRGLYFPGVCPSGAYLIFSNFGVDDRNDTAGFLTFMRPKPEGISTLPGSVHPVVAFSPLIRGEDDPKTQGERLFVFFGCPKAPGMS